MPDQNIYLLRGDDTFTIELTIKKIMASLGDSFDPGMNCIRLDGKTAQMEDIQTAVSTLPFFGGSRLVILEDVLSKMDKTRQEKFNAMLDSAPQTTSIVLIAKDQVKWKKEGGNWTRAWETLNSTHWMVKWFSAHENAKVIDLPLPDEKEMDKWIAAEVKRQGGKIEPDAAVELARNIGNETSIAHQEIAKLLTYVDYLRPITREDVLELVSEEGSTDVFVMLDLLMDQRTREAQAMMRRLLDDNPAEVVLGAAAHRFRQLIQVREALDAEEDPKTLADKRVIFYNQINKYTSAARRFSMQKLEGIYRRLLEMDIQAKTSQADLATSLELLVLEIGK